MKLEVVSWQEAGIGVDVAEGHVGGRLASLKEKTNVVC